MTFRCPKCGTENEDKASKCKGCGFDIKEQTVSFGPEETDIVKGHIFINILPKKKTLTVIFPENIKETFELENGTYRIGRNENSEIFLNDLTVSRNHAQITVKGSEVIISDLGSLNGTFVNGKIIEEPQKLKDGDVIQFGRFRLLFKVGEVKQSE